MARSHCHLLYLDSSVIACGFGSLLIRQKVIYVVDAASAHFTRVEVAEMQYLQVDAAKSTLYVYPAERDWSDYREDKHFEYPVATLRLFNGQPFSVEINAADVPWAAVRTPVCLPLQPATPAAPQKPAVSINVIGASTAVHTHGAAQPDAQASTTRCVC